MEEKERERAIHRILVALDASPHSLAALEAAAELAASMDAELLGLFVEDINLVRLADLPFAQEVGGYSAVVRKLDAHQLERQLRAQANRARRAIARLADLAQLRWSFDVVRGAIPTELLTAAMKADLIILGKTGWSGRRRMGSTAQAVVAGASQLTLILQKGFHLGLTAVTIYDGSEEAETALRTAGSLVLGRDGSLTVLLDAEDSETAKQLQSTVTTWVREQGIPTQFRWLTRMDVPSICDYVQAEGDAVLVLSKGIKAITDETLNRLLEAVECPVLLVQ